MKFLPQPITPWLDVAAIAAWGFLLLHYWLGGKLNLLIHPNYNGLTISAGAALLLIALLKGYQLWKRRRSAKPVYDAQHLAVLPKGWGSALMLIMAIAGLLITPRAFASATAVQRGAGEGIILTQVRPQAFRGMVNPESRSLIDWIRTLQVYPEPDAYQGQKVKVQGFAMHPGTLPGQYLSITRFVITCCAADVYPVHLPVKLMTGDRASYPVDQWFEVEGQMITETIEGRRQAVVQANSLKPIAQPQNPYAS
ncbi:MAG: TIGR03943 family protein [Alkalinema sp. RU_4_3]|nr:TIGR03943 family protein [Alkalinema sp. RU_4_3]